MNFIILMSIAIVGAIFSLQKLPYYEILKLSSFGIFKNDYLIFVSVSLVILFTFLAYHLLSAIDNVRQKGEVLLGKKECFLFLLLSVYPALNIFSSNFTETNYKIGLWFILFFMFISVLIFSILKFAIKNEEKAVYCTLIFSIFINFAGVYPRYMFSFFALIMFFCIAVLIYNTEKLKKPLIAFSLVLMFFVSVDFIKNAYVYIKFPEKKETFAQVQPPKNDVYIIVSDMYAGSDTLSDDYNFDNSYFYNDLRKIGFEVFDSTFSNYNKTQMTIGSVLNADYISNLKFKTFDDAFSNAYMFKKAKEKGYKTNAVMNLTVPNKSRYIDEITSYNKLDIGCQIIAFLNRTALRFILEHCESIDNSGIVNLILNSIVPKYKQSGGNFYFVHILAPHYPYAIPGVALAIYDKGTKVNGEHFANKERYIRYLNYVNYEILNTVKTIIRNSKEPPVIVITGDHGTRLHFFATGEKERFNSLINEEHFLRAHFNTFFAIYCPEKEKERYMGINSLVNFFVEFTNARFDENKPRKEDKFYYLFTNESNTNYKRAVKKYVELKKEKNDFIPYLLKEE